MKSYMVVSISNDVQKVHCVQATSARSAAQHIRKEDPRCTVQTVWEETKEQWRR